MNWRKEEHLCWHPVLGRPVEARIFQNDGVWKWEASVRLDATVGPPGQCSGTARNEHEARAWATRMADVLSRPIGEWSGELQVDEKRCEDGERDS